MNPEKIAILKNALARLEQAGKTLECVPFGHPATDARFDVAYAAGVLQGMIRWEEMA